jgi:hypothetical protein
MDGNRFDAVARSVASVSSRRDALYALTGFALAAVAGDTAEAKKKHKKKKKKKCKKFGATCGSNSACCQKQCCFGTCINAGEVCCQTLGGPTNCPAGQVCCDPARSTDPGCAPPGFTVCCQSTGAAHPVNTTCCSSSAFGNGGACESPVFPHCCPPPIRACCEAGFPTCCVDALGPYCCAPGFVCCPTGCCAAAGTESSSAPQRALRGKVQERTVEAGDRASPNRRPLTPQAAFDTRG